MVRAPAWALCCSLAVADGLLGCGTSCDKENEDVASVFDDPRGTAIFSCTSFQSGSFEDSYVPFPAGRRWSFEHRLQKTPDLLKSYLAFVENPLSQGRNGNTAESAGNQVIIERVDADVVQVRNDTCENFFLRLVVAVDEPEPECLTGQVGGAGGAAGSGG